METLKHIFGFMLMASCLWLFWVLIDQIDAYDQPLVLSTLFVTAFLLWITGRFYTQKWVSMGALSLLIIVACAPYLLSDKKNDLWEAYDPVKLTRYREEGRPVFVDFTARWCLTCQVNKKMALERPNVLAAFKKNHVVLMRADWTNKSDQITKALEQLGQRGVPVSAFYPKNGQDVRILPTLLTPQIILSSLE
jgi:thiol:disulfide interchange protein